MFVLIKIFKSHCTDSNTNNNIYYYQKTFIIYFGNNYKEKIKTADFKETYTNNKLNINLYSSLY